MPRDEQGTQAIKGFLQTINEITDIGYYPVCYPVFLAKLPAGTTPPETEGQIRVLTPNQASFCLGRGYPVRHRGPIPTLAGRRHERARWLRSGSFCGRRPGGAISPTVPRTQVQWYPRVQ